MKIIDGPHIDHVWLGVAVMATSGFVNLFVSKKVLYPVARRTESAALEADAAHLLTDVYTSFGVAGGLLLVKITGWEYLDPIAAIAVAVLIIKTGYDLVIQSTRVLLDETLPEDELEEIRRCVVDHKGDIIWGYHRLRARRAGSRRHIDLHMLVDEDLTVAEAHEWPSTSPPTSAAACPTPTCWCTWSRAPRAATTASRRDAGRRLSRRGSTRTGARATGTRSSAPAPR